MPCFERLPVTTRQPRPVDASNRRLSAGLAFRTCRIECVSKWVSLHSFEVSHVPDAMTRRADRALGRREQGYRLASPKRRTL